MTLSDEGITGTSMKKRTEFKRMIAACKRGRIDMILTKSLSRFARNTVDCLDTVRILKANGIGVIFEKENINTLTESSEFLITLFSGFAQAESESLSKNVRQGKQFGMKDGIVHFQYKKLLGYRRGENGQPEIVPEEAETVRKIYCRYLEGASEGEIKRSWRRTMFPQPPASRGGPTGWSTAFSPTKNTSETPCCKRPMSPTVSVKRWSGIGGNCPCTTSKIIIRVSSPRNCSSGCRRRWPGGPASGR